jgi:hypothetical protein
MLELKVQKRCVQIIAATSIGGIVVHPSSARAEVELASGAAKDESMTILNAARTQTESQESSVVDTEEDTYFGVDAELSEYGDDWARLPPEANLEGVAQFTADGCGATWSPIPGATEAIDGIKSTLLGWGWESAYVKTYRNSLVWQSDLSDESLIDGGNDHSYMDKADVGYLNTHGLAALDANVLITGNRTSGGGCIMRYGVPGAPDTGGIALWGNDDLNILVLDACQTLQYERWKQHRFSAAVAGNLGAMLGFHGNTFDSPAHNNAVQSYFSNSRYSNLGKNWVAKLSQSYIDPGNNTSITECGVAMVMADSKTQADKIYASGGIQDWISAQNQSHTYYYFKLACDPSHSGGKLPTSSPEIE